jgi:geranylgeranyl pyrophosphate synthase
MSDRVSPAVLEEVESLGRRIGMVYQVMNDLMAFTTAADKGRFASSEHWSDIVSNRKNLVVSIAYEGLSVEQRARWHECLASYHHDASTVETIVGMIESTNAVSQVVTWLSRHRSMVADRATGLPDTPARNLLIGALKSGNERSLFGGRTYRDLVDRLRLTYGPRTD